MPSSCSASAWSLAPRSPVHGPADSCTAADMRSLSAAKVHASLSQFRPLTQVERSSAVSNTSLQSTTREDSTSPPTRFVGQDNFISWAQKHWQCNCAVTVQFDLTLNARIGTETLRSSLIHLAQVKSILNLYWMYRDHACCHISRVGKLQHASLVNCAILGTVTWPLASDKVVSIADILL